MWTGLLRIAGTLAKALAVLRVRNTFLEDLHSGIPPSSHCGTIPT
jgi:hypothetical protein